MTNLEAKQEAIKKAYGEYWEAVKDFVDENGWIDFLEDIQRIMYFFHDSDNIEVFKSTWRPKSLQGIENNNGWIKIESEEVLPKNDMYVHIIFNKKVNIAFLCNGELYNPNKVKYYRKGVTHYKPIEESTLPIY